MLFSSLPFILVFLPSVLIGAIIMARLQRPIAMVTWLVVASMVFYAQWHTWDLAWLLCSVIGNYWLSGILARHPRRWILALGVAGNLLLLGYFKYTNFALQTLAALTQTSLPTFELVLPLAISFHTFQQIAYLVDVRRGNVHRPGLMHYGLFVLFFPQLIAGPIIHHTESFPQIEDPKKLRPSWNGFQNGLGWFIIGLQKKLILADGIAAYADAVFNVPTAPTLIPAWIGALAYTLQLYFDFSGYSDMAIGLAQMFGVRLPDNFDSPYKAGSIIEFWRRWHITLSRWLREYLYIPLGGNRKGSVRRHVNLMLTMLLGGLWHGAGWTFVVWGGLHGFYLMVNHGWHAAMKQMGIVPTDAGPAYRYASHLLTMVAIVVAWVFFRAPSFDKATQVLSAMAGLHGITLPDSAAAMFGTLPGLTYASDPGFTTEALAWLAGLFAIVFFAPNSAEIMGASKPGWRRTALVPLLSVWGIAAVVIAAAKGTGSQSFIYMIF